jgi:hypothetical protein
MTDAERLISRPPHKEEFFSELDFVYDPDSKWGDTRTGWIVNKAGVLWIHQATATIGNWIISTLNDYQGAIGKHVLINTTSTPPRMSADAGEPWTRIWNAALKILSQSPGRRKLLPELIQAVSDFPGIEKDLIEDTLRMMVSMGSGSAEISGEKTWYRLHQFVHEFYDRIDYLSSLSEELLAQSRKVDFLIHHSGTVGNFREELFRGFLRKILPGKFEVSTGFIEDSARQLDVIVWDSLNYAPLFREGEVVVVPRDSVRAVVEVKTKLETNALDQALDLLFEVTVRHPQVVPIFQGVFAFEEGYKSDKTLAERIKEFSSTRDHLYFFQAVTAVCVAQRNFIYQGNETHDKRERWPRPCLYGLSSESLGDPMTAGFIGFLMAHLDLPKAAKKTLSAMYQPVTGGFKRELLVRLFGDEWRPRLILGELQHIRTPQGASNYVERIASFYVGEIESHEVAENAPAPSKSIPQRVYITGNARTDD